MTQHNKKVKNIIQTYTQKIHKKNVFRRINSDCLIQEYLGVSNETTKLSRYMFKILGKLFQYNYDFISCDLMIGEKVWNNTCYMA